MTRALPLALIGLMGCAHSTETVEARPNHAAHVPPAPIASTSGDHAPSPSAPLAPSVQAPELSEPIETGSPEAMARAHDAPGTVFVLDRALYLSTRSGEAKLLDDQYGGDDSLASMQLSADRLSVAFVKHVPESELWLASMQDGSARRLLTARASDEPQHNLTGFVDPRFSPDGATIFFLAEGWATSGALHAIDIHTLSERFVMDAVAMLIIPSGPHVGQLFVERHQYKNFAGEGFHAFEWCGIVNTAGQIVRTLSEDESVCPGYAPGDRAKVEAALRIPAGGPHLP